MGAVEVVPDWICEILSPSTESKDRQIKMPLYARYGVGFAWLVDPLKAIAGKEDTGLRRIFVWLQGATAGA